MRSISSSRAAPAWGFMARFAIMLGMGLGLMPAEAAPFAYVAIFNANAVSVIDTATTPPSVVASVGVGGNPVMVAVTPDGKHAYVTSASGGVSVIDTATNKVMATVAVPQGAGSVAVTPDGKHVYVTGNVVSVIDTATNKVGATVTVGSFPVGVAIAPDGNTSMSRIMAPTKFR